MPLSIRLPLVRLSVTPGINKHVDATERWAKTGHFITKVIII